MADTVPQILSEIEAGEGIPLSRAAKLIPGTSGQITDPIEGIDVLRTSGGGDPNTDDHTAERGLSVPNDARKPDAKPIGLLCPNCNSVRLCVLATRRPALGKVTRYRKCVSCETRVKTVERILPLTARARVTRQPDAIA